MIKKLLNSSPCRVYSLKTPKIWPIAGRGMINMLQKISTNMILLSSMFVTVLFFESMPYFSYKIIQSNKKFPKVSSIINKKTRNDNSMGSSSGKYSVPSFLSGWFKCSAILKWLEWFWVSLGSPNWKFILEVKFLTMSNVRMLLRCRFTYSAF